MSNRPHAHLETVESLMAQLAACTFALDTLDRRLYALCCAPILTDTAIEAVQEACGEMRAALAVMTRLLKREREL